jgi:hypothetical protein
VLRRLLLVAVIVVGALLLVGVLGDLLMGMR